MAAGFVPKILVLATERCAYPGADAVGKAHQEYGSNVYVFRVPSPVLFPEDFYLGSFARGIDGILIAACGSDCPYRGASDRLAKRIDALTARMRRGGLEIERIRITAICTVCIKAYLKEVDEMNAKLLKVGPVNRAKARLLQEQAREELRSSAAAVAA